MNYIQYLQDKNAEQARITEQVRTELYDLIHYLHSSKFSGVDADYVHISTDLMPKLASLKMTLAKI